MDELSIGEARRMALAAQGFTEKRPRGTVGRKHLQKVVDRLGVIQLDSVNVAVRSHYMPFFSRLGPYTLAELDTLAWGTHHLFEYWGHQASLLPVEQHPLHRWNEATLAAPVLGLTRTASARVGEPGWPRPCWTTWTSRPSGCGRRSSRSASHT